MCSKFRPSHLNSRDIGAEFEGIGAEKADVDAASGEVEKGGGIG